MNSSNKHITLKHLFINQERQIGLQFYPDKVIQALVKELPNPKWSEKFNMVYVANKSDNLNYVLFHFRLIIFNF